jgi:hypothetical protein
MPNVRLYQRFLDTTEDILIEHTMPSLHFPLHILRSLFLSLLIYILLLGKLPLRKRAFCNFLFLSLEGMVV